MPLRPANFGHKPHCACRVCIGVNVPITDRFWRNVEKSDTCWTWVGGLDEDGYGSFRERKKLHRAHRFSYELHHGPIAKGLVVCHQCDNPSCVRPDHLYLGTQSDNMHDMWRKGRGVSIRADANSAKTHCPMGHPYDEQNTAISGGRRHCRACARYRKRLRRSATSRVPNLPDTHTPRERALRSLPSGAARRVPFTLTRVH